MMDYNLIIFLLVVLILIGFRLDLRIAVLNFVVRIVGSRIVVIVTRILVVVSDFAVRIVAFLSISTMLKHSILLNCIRLLVAVCVRVLVVVSDFRVRVNVGLDSMLEHSISLLANTISLLVAVVLSITVLRMSGVNIPAIVVRVRRHYGMVFALIRSSVAMVVPKFKLNRVLS